MLEKSLAGLLVLILLVLSMTAPRGTQILVPAKCPACRCNAAPTCLDLKTEEYGYPAAVFRGQAKEMKNSAVLQNVPNKILTEGLFINLAFDAMIIGVSAIIYKNRSDFKRITIK